MIDQPAYVKILLQKYVQGTATAVELARLMAAWDVYDDEEISAMIAEVIANDKTSEPAEQEKEEQEKETEPVVQNTGKKTSRLHRFFPVLLFLIAAFLIWFFVKPTAQPQQYLCDGLTVNTLLPTAAYQCSLVFANGSKMLIDSTKKGWITEERDLTIQQPAPGLLVYQQVKNSKNKTIPVYHTIQTEPGQQYRVLLPDGTQLRLNAASTIRFAVAGNRQRTLYLQGEALFDIVPDSTAPFVVYTGNTVITVQQARLNVKAYAQLTVATLIKGNMNIKAGHDSVQLTPGNGAMAAAAMQLQPRMRLMKADTMAAVSWTKTTRIYNHASMREFVADLGRWYNLEVVNLSCIPAAARISIVICANTPVEKLLEIFTDHKLKFYKVGNRITFCDPVIQPRPVSNTLPLASIE